MAKRSESSGKSAKKSSGTRGKGRAGHKAASGPETASEKVGSSEKAAEHFAGRNDFGIPAEQAQPGQQTIVDGSIDARPLGSRMPPDPDGARTRAVGAPNSGPGSYSGGDLDPDFIGVGTGSGVAASPPDRTEGPDIIESVHDDDKTFGPPSHGDNQLPPGTHGTTGEIHGTVIDRGDRQVHLGTGPSGNDDALPHDDVGGATEGGLDRSGGEDVDDREASTGAD